MDAAAFWISGAINLAAAIALTIYHRRRVVSRKANQGAAEIAFGLQYLVIGLPTTIALFFLLINWFETRVGHGELLVAGPIGLIALSFALMKVGTILIKWKPMRW